MNTIKIKKKFITFLAIVLTVGISIIFQNCSQVKFTSAQESLALGGQAFSAPFSEHDVVAGVHSQQDSMPATNPYHAEDIVESIRVPLGNCAEPGRYEKEKQMALDEAKADTTHQTIPVKFAYSFGKKHDALAKYANERAVLSKSNPGHSYIPVGPKNASTNKGKHIYYIADNKKVAEQYIKGERCFFGTVKLKDPNPVISSKKYDFVTSDDTALTHMAHYMYYGWCNKSICNETDSFVGDFANRLFQLLPSVEENGDAQIVKLYMADFRSGQLSHDFIKLSETTQRGKEQVTSLGDAIDICKIHDHYYDITRSLTTPKEVNGYTFDEIKGNVQLIHNLLTIDEDATILASQYTPIVLDLGKPGVHTSSVNFGTYFNMAALENDNLPENDPNRLLYPHRTSWIGGSYADYNPITGDNTFNLDVRIKAEDGFLVLPDGDGGIRSSRNLFGDNIEIGGKKYENGFIALQALADKDCTSEDIKKRYLGPWDRDLYQNKIKVWVDENRNGKADDGEVKSLPEHNIVAINTCNILHTEDKDAFGNGTQLRSAFLRQADSESIIDDENEIINRLKFGTTASGNDADFRLAIDLIFQTDESKRCLK